VQYGLCHFTTDYSIPFPDLAVAAEERGFESIWLAEHSHIPASRKTPFPGGGELPKMYYDTLDPFVALGAAASVTRRIKLATGVALVIQRDPIHTAKEVASLDVLSKGRVLFGVGAGWNLEEMADHGTREPEKRGTLLRERIEAMKAIWTEKQAEYHGEHVDFDPIFAWPKPAQKPHPPIHVGGAYPGGMRRAIRYGDGWIPILGRGEDVAGLVPAFRKEAAAAGRDPDSLEISAYGCPPQKELVTRLRDAGVSRVVFFVPSAQDDVVLPILDAQAELAGAVG